MARFGALAVLLLAAALAGCGQTTGAGSGLNVSAFGPADAAVAPPGAQAIVVSLDSRAAKAAREAEYRALEFGRAGTPVDWRAGKFYGDVVPGAIYQVNTSTCRDYVHTLYVAGTPQKSRSTACRAANGAWQPVT